MGYNAVDLLNKAVAMSEKKRMIFKKIKDDCNGSISMKIVIDVLIKDIEKTIEYYDKLKQEAAESCGGEIDFAIYDKISFLINQFNERIFPPEVYDVRDFLSFSLDYEKQVYGLMVDIQGRLVQKDSDTKTQSYKILTKIIKRKIRQIEAIEKNIR